MRKFLILSPTLLSLGLALSVQGVTKVIVVIACAWGHSYDEERSPTDSNGQGHHK